ncbi:MAG: hypothetical protein ACRDJ3_00655, partial [Solirubrobacteraceae bacterium]
CATSELAHSDLKATVKRARIGVFPPAAQAARPRLFAAFEEAYPVCFEGREDGDWEGFDAVIAIDARGIAAPPPKGVSLLWATGEEAALDGEARSLVLSDSPMLARALRGARLSERFCPQLRESAPVGYRSVLATVGGAAAWVAEEGGDQGVARSLVAAAPAELEVGESLRERLAPGRCFALLALVNFIRSLPGVTGTPAQQVMAAFVLDDPNLHWPSYGHVRYRRLAAHASEHGYHMVIAMPPLDGGFAHPRAVQIFKQHPAQLSICIHGNDHLGPELGRISTDRDGLVLAQHALARAAAFQRRTGIPFEPVMVPPHEQLSEPGARGLLAGGFDAVCVSRPYPWIVPSRSGPAAALGTGPPELGALAGWAGREMVVGGLPLMLRTGFNAPREDLVLRAFLGQPLIVYGHHDVLKDGLDVLADAASAVNALGEIRWGSLAQIARSGPARRRIDLQRALPKPRVSLRPLLRRLSSEARDRARLS